MCIVLLFLFVVGLGCCLTQSYERGDRTFIPLKILIMKHKLTLASKLGAALLIVLPSLVFSNSASAVEVKYFYRIPYIVFSTHGGYLRNPDNTVWTNPKTGEPKYEVKFDPAPVNGVTKIGVDFSFDPSRLQIDTDPSKLGFLCNFSLEGICPSNNVPPLYTATYGSPLAGSSWSFNVDNLTGRATFEYDFSTTPVDITANTDFFAFQVDSLAGLNLSVNDINQNYTSSKQYCKTTISDQERFSNNCGEPIPEPNLVLGIFTLGTIGLGSTLKRKLKSSKSSEKETTKVS